MERERPATGEVYHVYNRGVDKRVIFDDDQDRIRFVHDLWEFNDRKPAQYIDRRVLPDDLSALMYEVGLPTSKQRRSREKLVDILAWVLMPNHFHLILRPRVDNGVTIFMRKLGTGYVNAFNLKKDRVGPLFQGVYKFKHINREAHFCYLPHYIHLNPIALTPNGDQKTLLAFLDSYRWSSFQDYCGKTNFPSIIETQFIAETFGSKDNYRNELIEWLREGEDAVLGDVLLD